MRTGHDQAMPRPAQYITIHAIERQGRCRRQLSESPAVLVARISFYAKQYMDWEGEKFEAAWRETAGEFNPKLEVYITVDTGCPSEQVGVAILPLNSDFTLCEKGQQPKNLTHWSKNRSDHQPAMPCDPENNAVQAEAPPGLKEPSAGIRGAIVGGGKGGRA